jgi:hypothetical protein
MSNTYYPLETKLRDRKMPIHGVKELSWGKTHDVYDGAPCEWSKEQGATHTLYCGEVEGPYGLPGKGTRPAILKKTVLYVGVDEDEYGKVVWEKWQIKRMWTFDNNQ